MFYEIVILRLLNQEMNPLILTAAFVTGFVNYNINRMADFEEDKVNHPDRTKFFLQNRIYFIGIFTFSYALVFFLNLNNLCIFLVSLFPIPFVLAYTKKWIPTIWRRERRYIRLKEIPILKNFIVATLWSLFLYLLTFFSLSKDTIFASMSWHMLTFLSVFIFFRMFINSTCGDLIGMAGDAKSGVKTIPVLLGYKRTLAFLFLLNTLSLSLFSFLYYETIVTFDLFWINLSITIYCFIYLYLFTTQFNKKLLYDFVVDGEIVLSVILATLVPIIK